jgi:hypothetical protein
VRTIYRIEKWAGKKNTDNLARRRSAGSANRSRALCRAKPCGWLAMDRERPWLQIMIKQRFELQARSRRCRIGRRSRVNLRWEEEAISGSCCAPTQPEVAAFNLLVPGCLIRSRKNMCSPASGNALLQLKKRHGMRVVGLIPFGWLALRKSSILLHDSCRFADVFFKQSQRLDSKNPGLRTFHRLSFVSLASEKVPFG